MGGGYYYILASKGRCRENFSWEAWPKTFLHTCPPQFILTGDATGWLVKRFKRVSIFFIFYIDICIYIDYTLHKHFSCLNNKLLPILSFVQTRFKTQRYIQLESKKQAVRSKTFSHYEQDKWGLKVPLGFLFNSKWEHHVMGSVTKPELIYLYYCLKTMVISNVLHFSLDIKNYHLPL